MPSTSQLMRFTGTASPAAGKASLQAVLFARLFIFQLRINAAERLNTLGNVRVPSDCKMEIPNNQWRWQFIIDQSWLIVLGDEPRAGQRAAQAIARKNVRRHKLVEADDLSGTDLEVIEDVLAAFIQIVAGRKLEKGQLCKILNAEIVIKRVVVPP